MDIKLVIGMTNGKTVQKHLKTEDAKPLIGLKIGNTFKGESVNLSGYEFLITGGSDVAGFPMRKDVQGIGRKKIWSTKSIGVRDINQKGLRIRKSVAGNTVGVNTAQLNLKVMKEGKAAIEGDKAEKKE